MKILNDSQISKIISGVSSEYTANEKQIAEVVEGFSSIRAFVYRVAMFSIIPSFALIAISVLFLAYQALFSESLSGSTNLIVLSSVFLILLSLFFIFITHEKVKFQAILLDPEFSERVENEIKLNEFAHVLNATDGTQLGIFNYYSINRTAFFVKNGSWNKFIELKYWYRYV
ncbi:hypothetical protein [Pseudomonas syringae]|uniref:hypothetical protein n=1 Tax=Pseudomonas syringae TaxID=317 RepID=UPI000A246A16|nr:hypothetical protein [Pseudomonas syringae]OSO49009.1 hypothetical protein BV364_00019 [Pseudomonas syringae pv. actinidiae]